MTLSRAARPGHLVDRTALKTRVADGGVPQSLPALANCVLVVLGFIGLAFRKRLTPVEPTENEPVTTPKEGSNRTGKARGKGQPQIGGMTKKPTDNDLRDVNEDMFAAIVELYESKTTPRIEKP